MARTSLGGNTFYLFSDPGNLNLIITAHGGKPDTNEKMEWPPKDAGTPTIWFFSRHGRSTCTQVSEILSALSGDQTDFDRIKGGGFHPLLQKEVFNYRLQKYAGSGSNDYETYSNYESWVMDYGFDIVSPRHRWFSSEITLASIFEEEEIKSKGYNNVYCSFCRS